MSYRTHAKYKSNFSTWESLDEYAELMIDYIEAYKVFRERYSIDSATKVIKAHQDLKKRSPKQVYSYLSELKKQIKPTTQNPIGLIVRIWKEGERFKREGRMVDAKKKFDRAEELAKERGGATINLILKQSQDKINQKIKKWFW